MAFSFLIKWLITLLNSLKEKFFMQHQEKLFFSLSWKNLKIIKDFIKQLR
jgi:hypothetical protein